MNIELLTQPISNNGKNFSLGDTIISILTSKKPKYKTATFIFGAIKSNALEHLKPYLTNFIENNGTINFYIDSTKRISNNNLTNELLSIGCNIFVFNSEDSITEFQYRGCFFETSKKAEAFLTSGNLSMNGLFNSFNLVTHISFNDYAEFTDFKSQILTESLLTKFIKISDSENSWNSSKSYINSIPSIDEFTQKNDKPVQKSTNTSDDSNILIEIDDNVEFLIPENTVKEPKKTETKGQEIITSAKTIDSTKAIEYPTETIYYNTDTVLDVENFLFESRKNNVVPKNTESYLTSKNITESQKETILEEPVKNKIITKSSDLSKTAIFMFEASKITKRGVCAGEIKIPIYLRDSIASFWDWPTKYSIVGHAKIKSRICTFDIIDTAIPNKKTKDTNVKLFQREDESSFSIHSKELEMLNISENDIIRLIKIQDVDDTYYTCEIVRTDSKEYAIWEQFCTSEMKNSKRKYGIM